MRMRSAGTAAGERAGMKHRGLLIGINILAVCLWLNASPSLQAEEKRLRHAIVAVVNGEQITRSNVKDSVNYLLRQRFANRKKTPITEKKWEEIIEQYRIVALRELIKVHLIKHEAKAQEVTVKPERVEARLRYMGMKTEEATPLQRNMAEAEELFEILLAREGKWPVTISPKAIRDFRRRANPNVFKTNCMIKVRHTFLSTRFGRNPKEVARRAEALRAKILATALEQRGKYFANVARELNADKFARNGGLLMIGPNQEGWFPQEFPNLDGEKKPIFPQPMYQGIQNLVQKGQVPPVIRSQVGFHILYLEAIHGGKEMPWAQVQKLIRQKLIHDEREQLLHQWLLSKLKRSAVAWHDGTPFSPDEAVPLPAKGSP